MGQQLVGGWRWKWAGEKSNNFWHLLLLRSHLSICPDKPLKRSLPTPTPTQARTDTCQALLSAAACDFGFPRYSPAAASWATFMIAEFLFLIRRAGNCGHLCFIYLVWKCFLHEFLFSAEKINCRRCYLGTSKTFCRVAGSSFPGQYHEPWVTQVLSLSPPFSTCKNCVLCFRCHIINGIWLSGCLIIAESFLPQLWCSQKSSRSLPPHPTMLSNSHSHQVTKGRGRVKIFNYCVLSNLWGCWERKETCQLTLTNHHLNDWFQRC